MKKIVSLVAVLLFVSGSAFSYDINDSLGDQIGESVFDIHGIDYNLSSSGLSFDIYENYPSTGKTVGGWHTFSGDLFLDLTGDYVWDVGVAMTGHDGFSAGSLYSVSSWNTSNDYAPSGGYIYNEHMPVTINEGQLLLPGTVTWNNFGTGIGDDPKYRVSIFIPLPGQLPFDYEDIPVLDKKHLFFASATCANDYVGAPEPISTILFITGGTVLVARRFTKKKRA